MMTFQRPELLALAPLAALLFALAVGAHWRRLRRLEAAYGGAPLRRLFPVRLDRFPTGRLLTLVAAGLAIGLAAAGPLWLRPEPPEPPPPLDVTIAVDISLSMAADDGSPTRIERARRAIDRLTEVLPTSRLSLVVFAAFPYALTEPTDDPSVVRYLAESLRPEAVPELGRGNSLSSAIDYSRRALESRPKPNARTAIVVLTDGDVYEEVEVVARAAAASARVGTRVWVGGIGSVEGAPISVEGETVRDAGGRAILVRQDVDLLSAVATEGEGRYEDITDDDGLASFIAGIEDLSGHPTEPPPEPFDATALLALLVIPLLLLESGADAGHLRRTDTEGNADS